MSDTIRPEALASELGVNGKLVRAYLRREFARPAKAKNTAWVLTAAQAEATREYFISLRAPEADEATE